MLVIRFNRFGKKNQSHFRVVLQEKSSAPGNRHVEMLGSHNPHTKVTTLATERILYWIGQGAQPSDRVHNLLVKQGTIEGKIIPKKMPRPVKKEEAKPAEGAPSEAAAGEKAVAPATSQSEAKPADVPKEQEAVTAK